MRRSGLDYDQTLLLLVGVVFLNVFFYILECVRSLLVECDIVFIHILRMPGYNYMGTKRLVNATRGVKTEHKLNIS